MEVHCYGEQNVIYFCITEPTPLFQERKKGSRKFELSMESIRPYKFVFDSIPRRLFSSDCQHVLATQDPLPVPRKICDI
jgi:hypothetical protein